MLVAIDIGSRHIHMVEGEYNNKKFKIINQVTEQTPEGAVVDGEIMNQREIVAKLRRMLEKHKPRTKKVVFTINPGSMVSRQFVIPQVKEKETLPILQNEMNSVLNFQEPHIVDYTDVEKTDEGTWAIETVALSKEIIKQYWDMAKALKLTPVALDVHQNVMAKFVQSTSDIGHKNIIVADIGNTYMNTYLFKDGKRVFARRMLVNTEQYERTLVSLGRLKSVGEEFMQLDLSPHAIGEDPILDNTISLYLSNIVDQLQRVMQFQSSVGAKGQSSQVSHIYLCGAMTNMQGLTEYIGSYMDIPVRDITEIVSPHICKVDRLPQYVNAIGALVRLD